MTAQTESGIVGLRLVTGEESDAIGLKSVPHGLVFMTDLNGDEWTKVTDDMDYFDIFVAAVLVNPTELTVVRVEKFPIILHGWPNVGSLPDPPTPERD